jgi:hypothetical protein
MSRWEASVALPRPGMPGCLCARRGAPARRPAIRPQRGAARLAGAAGGALASPPPPPPPRKAAPPHRPTARPPARPPVQDEDRVGGLFAKAREHGARQGNADELEGDAGRGGFSTFQGQGRTLAGSTTQARAPARPARPPRPAPPAPPPATTATLEPARASRAPPACPRPARRAPPRRPPPPRSAT